MRQDFAFALRQLRTSLKFSVIVVLTLALGIGATTAIFSVVSGVLLRALPFPGAERIVSLQTIEYAQADGDSKDSNSSSNASSTAANASAANPGMITDVSFPDFF